MFDFTSLFQSENASRIIERKGKKIFLSLVGDSLLEVSYLLSAIINSNNRNSNFF
jgi:hypothetical protein